MCWILQNILVVFIGSFVRPSFGAISKKMRDPYESEARNRMLLRGMTFYAAMVVGLHVMHGRRVPPDPGASVILRFMVNNGRPLRSKLQRQFLVARSCSGISCYFLLLKNLEGTLYANITPSLLIGQVGAHGCARGTIVCMYGPKGVREGGGGVQ